MSSRELHGWLAYFVIESEEQAKAAKDAQKAPGNVKRGNKPKGGVRLGNRRKVPKPE